MDQRTTTEITHGAAGRDAAAMAPVLGGGLAPSVLVIGAGVSGCACAATLASAGLRVTLINSAMDRVGLPAYGPDLVGAGDLGSGLDETMAALPSPLRAVWLEASMAPACGGAVMNIDRRRVSVETKRLLEGIPGLQFRQGFVVDLRVTPPEMEGASVTVRAETIFGEVFEADAAVVAAGLSLGGRSSVGGGTIEGGRYGEPASNELLGALEALGAEFREVVLQVGARSAAEEFATIAEAVRRQSVPEEPVSRTAITGAVAKSSSLVTEACLRAVAEGDEESAWPADYPPAPHRNPALRLKRMLVVAQKARDGKKPSLAECFPVVSPDGAATSEIYIAPNRVAVSTTKSQGFRPLALETRMPETVTASAVTNLSWSGRLVVPASCGRIWAVGRCAGAEDYAQSLASGVRGGLDISAVVGGRGDGA